MASIPGARHCQTPSSPWSDATSGHDTEPTTSLPPGKRKYSHTTAAQRQYLVDWLELPDNFELLTKPTSDKRSEPSTSPSPKRAKKMDGYRSLAQHMNRVAQTDWSEKTARSRFESFMAAYRKAKRQSPHNLPLFFQRVDVLFGPDGDVKNRFRLESFGQKSDGNRSALVSKKEHDRVLQDLVVATPEAKTKVVRGNEQTSEKLITPGTNNQTLDIESQRLAVKQQELELKQSELRTRHEENRQKLRAEVLTKLVEAGKSPAEVREYLAIMDAVDNPPTTRP